LIPCRLSPPPLAVADGTDIGTIMAFVVGWFEFKSGFLSTEKSKFMSTVKKPPAEILSLRCSISNAKGCN
jgi:hypothetical protein